MDVQYKAVVTCSTGSTVRLRKEASQNSKIVYPVPKGSQVDVLEDGAEWSKVQYGSYTGYMMSQFLTPAEVEELAKDTEGAEKESSGLYLYEAVADLQKRVGELERLINEIRAEG